jgi:drug/metabolite transporter (DMT)-like permease
VSATVLLVVLLAAVLHASWNAIVHAITDRLVGFALMGVADVVVGGAIVALSPAPARASWPYVAVSAALHVVYTLLLMRCYRIGDFGQMYPISRGTSPWLVAIGAAVFAGESLPALRLLGVAVISAGLLCLVFAGGVPSRKQRTAIAAAVLTGVSIAAYTTVDGLGVRQAGTATGYTGWLFLLQGPALPIVALVVRREQLFSQARRHLWAGLTGGALSLLAYGLVLWAQTHGPLALVAALRESSVVAGALIGALVFHERLGRWRVLAAVLVALGVVIIAL